ncbi:hypothetical protein PAXINDRAFT_14869 [Paxillus involutus ATCC 200175]|uniref:Uncharacterized protein n=1 Tax=Paxillus involutus ATCC 200175 TaxID=664439 RepID=A0A0C9T9E3_PAXIN|nr:hypothetical protein PAXINDRAFT_14869 [Paxillus involutus ATCC 200175]
MSSHSMDHSQEHPSHTENHSSQKKRQSKVERIRNALAIVRDGKISFINFLNQILDPSEKEFKAYRTAIYSVDDNNPPKLYQLFDLILNDPRSGPLFCCWIEDQAVDMVSSKVLPVDRERRNPRIVGFCEQCLAWVESDCREDEFPWPDKVFMPVIINGADDAQYTTVYCGA